MKFINRITVFLLLLLAGVTKPNQAIRRSIDRPRGGFALKAHITRRAMCRSEQSKVKSTGPGLGEPRLSTGKLITFSRVAATVRKKAHTFHLPPSMGRPYVFLRNGTTPQDHRARENHTFLERFVPANGSGNGRGKTMRMDAK
uniref:Uncharacterized protein n=1 Tax=Anopheles atroparvus TaxID=41427 RepID=A0A182J1U8_ANOAO